MEGLLADVEDAMESYQAVMKGPTPTHSAIKKSQASLLQAVHKIGSWQHDVTHHLDTSFDQYWKNVRL